MYNNKRLITGLNTSIINFVSNKSPSNFTTIGVDTNGLSITNTIDNIQSGVIELDPPSSTSANISLTQPNDILKQVNLNVDININTLNNKELLLAKNINGLNVIQNSGIVYNLSNSNNNLPISIGDKKILVLQKTLDGVILDSIDSNLVGNNDSSDHSNYATLSITDNVFLNNSSFNYNNNNRISIIGNYSEETTGKILILNNSNKLVPSITNINNVALLNTTSLINYSTISDNNILYSSLSGNNNYSGNNIFNSFSLSGSGSGKVNISIPNISTDYTLQLPPHSNLSSSTWILGTTSTNSPYNLSWIDLSGVYLTQLNASSTYLTQLIASSTYLTQLNASSIYLTQTIASDNYLTKANANSTYLKNTDAISTYLTQINATSTYLTINDASLTYLTKNMALSTYLSLVNAALTYDTLDTAKTITGAKTFNVVNPLTISNPNINLTESSSNETLLAINNLGLIKSTNLAQNNIATLNTSSLINYSTTTAMNTALIPYSTTEAMNTALIPYSTISAMNTALSAYSTTAAMNIALSAYSTTAEMNTALSAYDTLATATTIIGTKTFDYSKCKIKLSNTVNDNTSSNQILLINTVGEIVPCDKTYSLLNSTLASGALTNVANTFTAGQTFSNGNLILNGTDSYNVTLNAPSTLTASYIWNLPLANPLSGITNVLTTSSTSSPYNLVWSDISSIYLTQTNAASTYLTTVNAGTTYMKLSGTNTNLGTNIWSGINTFDMDKLVLKGNANLTLNASQAVSSVAYTLEYPTAAPAGTLNILTSPSGISTKYTWTDLSTYLTTANAASTYLTTVNAGTTYMKLSGTNTNLGTNIWSGINTFDMDKLVLKGNANLILNASQAVSSVAYTLEYPTAAPAGTLNILTSPSGTSTKYTWTDLSTYLTATAAASTYSTLSGANTWTGINTYNYASSKIKLTGTTNNNTISNQILVMDSNGYIVPCDKTYNSLGGLQSNVANTFTAIQTFNVLNPIIISNPSTNLSVASSTEKLLAIDTSTGNLKLTSIAQNSVGGGTTSMISLFDDEFSFESGSMLTSAKGVNNKYTNNTFGYYNGNTYASIKTQNKLKYLSISNGYSRIQDLVTSAPYPFQYSYGVGMNLTFSTWIKWNVNAGNSSSTEGVGFQDESVNNIFIMSLDSNGSLILKYLNSSNALIPLNLNTFTTSNPIFYPGKNTGKWYFMSVNINAITNTLSVYIRGMDSTLYNGYTTISTLSNNIIRYIIFQSTKVDGLNMANIFITKNTLTNAQVDMLYTINAGAIFSTVNPNVPLPFEQLNFQDTTKTLNEMFNGVNNTFALDVTIPEPAIFYTPTSTALTNNAYGYYNISPANYGKNIRFGPGSDSFFTLGGANSQVKTILMWVNNYNIIPGSRTIFIEMRTSSSSSQVGSTDYVIYFAYNAANAGGLSTGAMTCNYWDNLSNTVSLPGFGGATSGGIVSFPNNIPCYTDNSAYAASNNTDKNWHLVGFSVDVASRKVYCYTDGVRTVSNCLVVNTSSATTAASNILGYPQYVKSFQFNSQVSGNLVFGNVYFFKEILSEDQSTEIYNNYLNKLIM